MQPVRLDPADPLASVLAWLAALARALGLDPAALVRPPRLNQVSAAIVRGWLSDWTRQLRALIRPKAERLALRLPVRRRTVVAPPVRPEPACSSAPAGRVMVAVAPRRRSADLQSRADRAPAVPRSLYLLIDPAEEAVLRRRSRAVLAALRDPSGLIRRLARRLALARVTARRDRPRFPLPPRVLGSSRPGPAPAPEPRPPDSQGRQSSLQHAPRLPRRLHWR